ncbi:YchF/TatD family DNA exonuclease [Candidatus Dependentiae bacterium]|nr:YchF/TatD family DNA exonuclease [Candidatus Dependentiae bacterium]
MFIDTHCHLNLIAKKKFDVLITEDQINNLKFVIEDAKIVGVESIITIGTSVQESNNCVMISNKFDNVYAVIGIHPCDCSDDWENDFKKIIEIVINKIKNKVVGIGETGLDFYHKPFDKKRQILAFKKHIELSIENELPIVVHVRESAQNVFEVLNEYKNKLKGVIHCFSQNKEFAKKFLDLGFYLGLNAPVTYPKNKIFREVVKYIPLDRILLETDAPFLPPQEFRGKINLPEYIPLFAKTIAELKNVGISELGKITTHNAKKLFKIK